MSTSNLERLKAIKSRKVARGEVAVHEEFQFDESLVGHTYPNQTYQDQQYRKGIAARYGIYLVLNPRGFWEPKLMEDGGYQPEPPAEQKTPSLFTILQERYQ